MTPLNDMICFNYFDFLNPFPEYFTRIRRQKKELEGDVDNIYFENTH